MRALVLVLGILLLPSLAFAGSDRTSLLYLDTLQVVIETLPEDVDGLIESENLKNMIELRLRQTGFVIFGSSDDYLYLNVDAIEVDPGSLIYDLEFNLCRNVYIGSESRAYFDALMSFAAGNIEPMTWYPPAPPPLIYGAVTWRECHS